MIAFNSLQFPFRWLVAEHFFSFTFVVTNMADKGQSQNPVGQPLMKIGYYILGETLGVGTFGKVKSKYKN